MEATLYWEWLATQLTKAEHTVQVLHAYHVKLNLAGARAKTDPIDARKLAELLRVKLFPSIWLPDPDTRERRPLLLDAAGEDHMTTVLPALYDAIRWLGSTDRATRPTTSPRSSTSNHSSP